MSDHTEGVVTYRIKIKPIAWASRGATEDVWESGQKIIDQDTEYPKIQNADHNCSK